MTTNENLVESEWETDFVIELRLRDVDGATIGDALQQVRSHCAESGQEVREAFGDPVAYARSLDLRGDARGVGGVVASSAVALVSMFLTLWGFTSWLDGEGFPLTVGRIVIVVLLCAVVGAIARYLDWVIRHPVWASVVASGAITVLVLAEVGLDTPLAVLPALAVAGVGAAGLVATTVWDVRSRHAADDPIISPVSAEPEPLTRAVRVVSALTPWLMPLGTAALLVLALVLHRLS